METSTKGHKSAKIIKSQSLGSIHRGTIRKLFCEILDKHFLKVKFCTEGFAYKIIYSQFCIGKTG
jgi:hypothetical protein